MLDLNSCKKIKSLTPLLHYFYAHLPPQLRPPLQIHITPYLHVSAAITHPWYPAADIRSNKIRTAGADWTTGQQRVSHFIRRQGDKLG